MPRRLTIAVLTLCLLTLAACGGSSAPRRDASDVEILQGTVPANAPAGTVPDYKPTGKLIADSGFRPVHDGFSFENYGDGLDGISNLTPAQVEELFGHEVCVSGTRATCKLIPPAQEWMEVENDALAAGHCFGMAVASERFYDHELHADVYGGQTAPALQLAGNAPLQQTIAETSAIQEVPAVRQQAIAGTPTQILDALVKNLKDKAPMYALGLFRADGAGGHAVTPYAVEDRGDGRYAVLVYDNNFPGVTRALAFDRHADAWRFHAQSNPDDVRELYGGDAKQPNIALYPSKLAGGLLPCPFCARGDGSVKPTSTKGQQYVEINEIALLGDTDVHAHLLITDAKGRHTGFIGKRFVNQIPGVEVERRLENQDWLEDAEPVYLVPVGVPVTVTVDGTRLRHRVTEQLDLIGPGDDLSVGGIELRRGEKVHIHFKGDGSGMSYRADPHHSESPVLGVGVELPGRSYDFKVKANRLKGGGTLRLLLDQRRRQLDIDTRETGVGGEYGVRFHRMGAAGTKTFEHDRLFLPRGTVARLDYGGFTHHGQSLPLELTEPSGSSTVNLTD